jgi:hypothetical protein
MKDLVFYLLLIIILYFVLTNIIDVKEKYYNSSNSSHAWYTGDENMGNKIMEIESTGRLVVKNLIKATCRNPSIKSFSGPDSLPSSDTSLKTQNFAAFFQAGTFNIGFNDNADIIHSSNNLTLVSDQGSVSTMNDFTINGDLIVGKDMFIPDGNLVLNDTSCISADGSGSVYITEYKQWPNQGGGNKTCGPAHNDNELPINR